MDDYIPTYCVRCSQLQWRNFIGKPCQFCGGCIFANVRPEPTFTQHDRRVMKDRYLGPKKRKEDNP